MWPDTYSQYDEEQAIARYFDDYAKGRNTTLENLAPEMRFLDIGAWDAKCFSNSRKLYERGWSGFVIEPSPDKVKALSKEYYNSRVFVIQAAVGLESTLIDMDISDDMVSTSDPATRQKHDREGGYYGRIKLVPLTWTQINNWLGGFQFVSIDAEGLSVDLFHAMLSSGQRPNCVCVEYDERFPELSEAATKAHYKLYYSNGTNAVFGQ